MPVYTKRDYTGNKLKKSLSDRVLIYPFGYKYEEGYDEWVQVPHIGTMVPVFDFREECLKRFNICKDCALKATGPDDQPPPQLDKVSRSVALVQAGKHAAQKAWRAWKMRGNSFIMAFAYAIAMYNQAMADWDAAKRSPAVDEGENCCICMEN